MLRRYEPINQLPPEHFEEVLRATSVIGVEAGTRFLERGSRDEWTFYLLEGAVLVVNEEGEKRLITGGTPSAHRPIAKLQPRMYDVVATESSKLIRVLTNTLLGVESRPPPASYDVNELSVEGDDRQAMLCLAILGDIEENALVLPTLPAQALRVRQMIQDDDADASTLAKALSSDATITAKLMRAANSALYSGAAPVGTCAHAIVRIGVETTSQLVLTFALKELFDPSSPILEDRMVALWHHSATMAGIAFALARTTSGFEPDRAMLAGFLHDIGATCVLSYADRQPDLAADGAGVERASEQLRGQLSGLILRSWNFPDDIVAAGEHAEDWGREGGPRADYCDLVVTAHLLDILSSGGDLPVPELGAVPALRKLFRRDVTPEECLEILEAIQPHITEIQNLLQV